MLQGLGSIGIEAEARRLTWGEGVQEHRVDVHIRDSQPVRCVCRACICVEVCDLADGKSCQSAV